MPIISHNVKNVKKSENVKVYLLVCITDMRCMYYFKYRTKHSELWEEGEIFLPIISNNVKILKWKQICVCIILNVSPLVFCSLPFLVIGGSSPGRGSLGGPAVSCDKGEDWNIGGICRGKHSTYLATPPPLYIILGLCLRRVTFKSNVEYMFSIIEAYWNLFTIEFECIKDQLCLCSYIIC